MTPPPYSPEAHGARCAECYLQGARDGDSVPPELHPGALALIVGEAPGADEVEHGAPFVGRSGQRLLRALRAHGLTRGKVSWTNALLCRPPGNKLDLAIAGWRRENKARAKRGELPLPNPLECCRPRLLAELREHDNVIPLGGVGLRAVTGSTHSILAMRGGPLSGTLAPDGAFVEGEGAMRVLPTLHPAFVLRAGRWQRAFDGDIGRAVRFFRGELGWTDPRAVYHPSPADLTRILARPERVYYFDTETDGLEPTTCKLRCVAIGTHEWVVLVPLLSIDGMTRFYTAADEARVREILRAFFVDPWKLKAGWNSGSYDRLVIEAQLGVTPAPAIDGILLHRAVDPELPHSLGYTGSIYTDIHAWKAGKEGTTAETDERLHVYCVRDVAVTARVIQALEPVVERKGLWPVVRLDHQIQACCVGMHRNGLFVDQAKRREWDAKLLADAIRYRAICRETAGRPNMNPASNAQVIDLLNEAWDLAPPRYSEKTGEPSTDDESLREYLVSYRLEAHQRAFVDALRRYRRATKYRGTFVAKLRPLGEGVNAGELAHDAEESQEEREARWKRDEKRPSVLLADGRVHPNWLAHGTVTGRLSSSGPNCQNIPRKLRNMFVPETGRTYVYADADQIELRMASAYWGAVRYLAIFAAGGDPHAETARMIFGDTAKALEAKAKAGDEKDWKRMRDFAKRTSYASLYGAESETVHSVIAAVESDKGDLIYSKVTLAEARDRHQAWLDANPEFRRGWESTLATWRRQGYLADPVLGRTCEFLDGEDMNKMVNFPIQSSASAVIHHATLDFVREVPFRAWGPGTGVIQQGHDALLVEVPIDAAERVRATLQECMTRSYPGLSVRFTAKAQTGAHWGAF